LIVASEELAEAGECGGTPHLAVVIPGIGGSVLAGPGETVA
jgi:hypothetical protein